MSIKEDFRGYRGARKAIRLDKQRLAAIGQVTDTVRGSSAEWPFTEHAMTVSGYDTETARELQRRIAKKQALCRRVEEAIRKAPNDKIRCILTMRYVDGMSWDDAAEAWAGEDERAPGGSAVRKIAERYIASL